MVIVNGIKFNVDDIIVSYGKYNVFQYGKERTGIGLTINFKCDVIIIGIETTYDLKWIESLKNNSKVDITKYISDITFKDKEGWMSLIIGEFDCLLTKNENDIINIELKYKGEECDISFDIYINEDINVEYKELSG